MEKLPFKVVGSTKCGLYVETEQGQAWISTRNVGELLQRPDAKYEILPCDAHHLSCRFVIGVYRLETI